MSYRQILIERSRQAFCDTSEAEILDYMGVRNRDAMNAWIMRRNAGHGSASALPTDLQPRLAWWSSARELWRRKLNAAVPQ